MISLKKRWRWRKSSQYRNPLYREYLYLKDRAKLWWKKRAFERAKKLAKARHCQDGKTYYVMMDGDGIWQALNNKEIELIKRAGLMNKKATCADLYREAAFIANNKTVKK